MKRFKLYTFTHPTKRLECKENCGKEASFVIEINDDTSIDLCPACLSKLKMSIETLLHTWILKKSQ